MPSSLLSCDVKTYCARYFLKEVTVDFFTLRKLHCESGSNLAKKRRYFFSLWRYFIDRHRYKKAPKYYQSNLYGYIQIIEIDAQS